MFSLYRKLISHKPQMAALIALSIGLWITACGRGERETQPHSPKSAELPPTSDLYAGAKPPTPQPSSGHKESAEALDAGKKLYSAYNCNGCHSAGGGGMGPPLMDEEWIYGGSPEQIVATLIQGRPNGMPSFRGKIPEPQMWQLAAYVRNLSEEAKKNATPGQQ
jgi:cytochrome c oxidase cbb3-type subunit III